MTAADLYPLPEDLTRRVLGYLAAFRLLVAALLAGAYFADALVQGPAVDNPGYALTSLVSYLVLALALAVEARRAGSNPFYVANVSLFVDVTLIGLMLYLFGGLDSGLGVLLVFYSAAAAILLPLRNALFMAAVATLAMLTETILGGIARTGEPEDLVRAGLFGLTVFITVLFAHLLGRWLRDYRLTAERQERTLVHLEQINELVIRRMRTGVLAVDGEDTIRLMNESAWFVLGSPPVAEQRLGEVSPELSAALEAWRGDPAVEIDALTLGASQAQIVPKFVALPGEEGIRTLVFLEDNDVVAQRALELSATSLARLSGSIAHEIRNPLAAVSHAAQLLAESPDLGTADQRLLDIIHNQSRRMNGIVENILQLSRREKSRPELFELVAWLEDLVREFTTAQSTAGAGIELALPGDGALDGALVMFDRSQLHQVLWKLVENACEHAGREGAPARVVVAAERHPDSGYCVVTVQDNGPGIPANQVRRIFDAFFTTRKQGSGLGLYIARQLCEANGAELTVDSTPGEGTRFHVRLALTRGETERPADHAA